MDPTRTAVGTWSGGRFMRFGEQLDDERLVALLRPDDGIRTVLTADVYGEGEADRLLGRALRRRAARRLLPRRRDRPRLLRRRARGREGVPALHRPAAAGRGRVRRLRRHGHRALLERIGADHFDLLLLHNPDRSGYTSPVVWEALEDVRERGLTRLLGVAPGPANGFTLDLIECFERFGSTIDWAMVILNPFEPWPAELALEAARRFGIDLMTRVVDYGGLFHDDVLPGHPFARHDHRMFRPEGWIEAGREKLDRIRPIAERHDLSMLQLACLWNLAQEPVRCVVPTLIQEPGEGARSIEEKRADLASLPEANPLSGEEIAEIRAVGDNVGSMALKGATPDHEGEPRPDRWGMDERLAALAERWGIDPERDLTKAAAAA